MRPLDLLFFLFGSRGAIERVAASRSAWFAGALLVLSAGIARNYDHLDLLRNPEWILGPFAASLFTSVFIFIWISGPLRLDKTGSWWRQSGTFVALVWMTAPCAWLYGIPVERFTDIVTATKWNIGFLAIVSFWRVAIMVRAVAVLTGAAWWRVLPLLLAPAALEAMVGAGWEHLSLIGIMGGVRLPPHTELLADAATFTSAASFWIFLGCIVASLATKGVAKRPLFREALPSRSCVGVAAACLVLWAAAALPSHPGVANRHRLETLIGDRSYAEAVAFAAEKGRHAFPPHHHLPPGPAPHFPLGLLDALPPDAPAWLGNEWKGDAVESLKLNFRISGTEWRDLALKHPEVAGALRAHADELRNRNGANGEDRGWLRHYEEILKDAEESPAPSGEPGG